MKCTILRCLVGLMAIVTGRNTSVADEPFHYHASLTAQSSSKSLAPYMLGSWNEGRYVEGTGIWQEAGFARNLDMSKRFSWSLGFDYLLGIGSKPVYDRWVEADKEWTTHSAHLPNFRLQQLFAQIKFRAVYMTVGIKSTPSLLVDDNLSSGDLTRSNNAAPILGVAGGFVDFQDIPFTKDWVQIDGEIMYGKLTDSKFRRAEFNYYSGDISQDILYHYKRCYFRTNPDKNFYVTIGMQSAGLFGGTTFKYQNGVIYKTMHRGFRLKDVLQMFFPREGGENYYTGAHLGSWDFKADYRLRDGSKLSAYFEWPWEDGSGIGRMNGWDGIWGIQYNFAKAGIVSKILFEYIDFTNQSGPIHYDPEDNPYNPITGHAQGADDYYNNNYYGAYTNYSMGIGTPFLVAPIYNTDGSLAYLHNRARGFHAALEGNPADWISYQVKIGYQLAGGYGAVPAYRRISSTSGMVAVAAHPFRKQPQWEMGLKLAFDMGKLRGDNFGAQLQVAYHGLFTLKKTTK